jgi:hypothetical protein
MNLPPKLDPKNQTPTDSTITKPPWNLRQEQPKKKKTKKNLGTRVERKLRWGKAAERERERERERGEEARLVARWQQRRSKSRQQNSQRACERARET